MAAQGFTAEPEGFNRSLGDGRFVLTTNEGDFPGRPASFYVLCRLPVAGCRVPGAGCLLT